MSPIVSFDQIQELISKIKAKGNGYYTNFFPDPQKITLWLEKQLLEFQGTGDTVFVLKRNQGFFNLFFIASRPQSLLDDLKNLVAFLPEAVFLADLLGKGNELDITNVFSQAGFYQYTSLVRMSRLTTNLEEPLKENKNISYGDIALLPKIMDLFEKYFDPYCEQVPLYEELLVWANESGIVVHRNDDGQIQGFVIFEQKGQTGYLRYWFVHPDHREKKIGSALIRKFFEDCKTAKRQIFWVIETNENAIKRYEYFGFGKDQLFDHVYINRSLKYETKDN